MYAIYGNIYHQYTPFMLAIYTSTMDPLGAWKSQKNPHNLSLNFPSQEASHQTRLSGHLDRLGKCCHRWDRWEIY